MMNTTTMKQQLQTQYEAQKTNSLFCGGPTERKMMMEPKILNLSSKFLLTEQTNLLEKGLKFTPTPKL